MILDVTFQEQKAMPVAFGDGFALPCSVLYTKQNLTDEQKAQARENIEATKQDDTKVGKDTWSSQKIVDQFCQDINESGAIVACEPLSGYPLTVQTDGATKVYRSGKNTIPPWTGSRTATGMTFKGNGDGSISITGTPTKQWTASCFIDIPPEIMKGGKTYSCTPASNSSYEIFFRYKDADGNFKNTEHAGVINRITWDDSWYEPQVQIHTPDIQAYNETVWLQLELGETATEYEPYVCEEFALGEAIPSLDGVNTIWADSGDVTVTGKADPMAIINDLCNKINALSATMTALTGGKP